MSELTKILMRIKINISEYLGKKGRDNEYYCDESHIVEVIYYDGCNAIIEYIDGEILLLEYDLSKIKIYGSINEIYMGLMANHNMQMYISIALYKKIRILEARIKALEDQLSETKGNGDIKGFSLLGGIGLGLKKTDE